MLTVRLIRDALTVAFWIPVFIFLTITNSIADWFTDDRR
jgi:hypothetical protein